MAAFDADAAARIPSWLRAILLPEARPQALSGSWAGAVLASAAAAART